MSVFRVVWSSDVEAATADDAALAAVEMICTDPGARMMVVCEGDPDDDSTNEVHLIDAGAVALKRQRRALERPALRVVRGSGHEHE